MYIAQAQESITIESPTSNQVTVEYVTPKTDFVRMKNAKAAMFSYSFRAEEQQTMEREVALKEALKYWEEKLPMDNSVTEVSHLCNIDKQEVSEWREFY